MLGDLSMLAPSLPALPQPLVLMAAKKTAKNAAKKPVKPVTRPRPSTDEIAKAAYLNYRRRIENDLPGSHESDWLEAERQLSEGK
jgi:hypothetical protein